MQHAAAGVESNVPLTDPCRRRGRRPFRLTVSARDALIFGTLQRRRQARSALATCDRRGPDGRGLTQEGAMLGEKIAEETMTTTGRRVLSVDGEPVIETSATATGKLFGVDYQTMVTYTGRLRADGIIAGEGRGVLMGNGGEHATFTAQGVGKFTQAGECLGEACRSCRVRTPSG